MYKHRELTNQLLKHIKHFSVIGLTGPRQSGKSTLLQHVFSDYKYITFDDPTQVELFETDPKGFINNYGDNVIFDEVHHVPEIFRYIKLAVDSDRQNFGKYILTSSNQFSFIKHASESLAGRIALLSLLPLQYSEMPDALKTESIFRGAYPELVGRAYQLSDSWYSSYLDTYLNKDIRLLGEIGNLRDFRRLINLLAANTSQTLNMSNYANDLGVAVNTIKRWVSLLEASYIIYLLPPYYNNLGKRITKSPKIYFYDTGLVSYLTGIKTKELFEQGPMAGSIFENYIITEIKKKLLHDNKDAELFYFRSSDQLEIDLIVDWKIKQDFIEIKNTETFRTKFTSSMEKLMPETAQGYLLYRGTDITWKSTIQVLNYTNYLITMS